MGQHSDSGWTPGFQTGRKPRLHSAHCAAQGVPAYHGPLLPPSGLVAPCSRASVDSSGRDGFWQSQPAGERASLGPAERSHLWLTLSHCRPCALRTHDKPVKRSRRAAFPSARLCGSCPEPQCVAAGPHLTVSCPGNRYSISTRPKPGAVLSEKCRARPCPQN